MPFMVAFLGLIRAFELAEVAPRTQKRHSCSPARFRPMATACVKASVHRKRLACGGTAKAAAKGMLGGRILIEARSIYLRATAGTFLETMAAAFCGLTGHGLEPTGRFCLGWQWTFRRHLIHRSRKDGLQARQ